MNTDAKSVRDAIGYDRGGMWAMKAYQTPKPAADIPSVTPCWKLENPN